MALRFAAARLGPLAFRSSPRLPAPAHRGALASVAQRLCTTADKSGEKTAEAAPAAEAQAEPTPAEEGAEAGADGPTVESLEARVAELDAQVAEKHDQVLRALADADNARRRAQLDVENAHKFGVSKFVKDLLDVADNLTRAAESVPEEMRSSEDHPQLKALYDGVVMTDAVLLKTFEKHGLKRLAPMGEKFDPNFHDALFEAPDPTKEPGTVMHVASPGYVLHDRCLRAAGVGVVAK